jgi:hypothetical protein
LPQVFLDLVCHLINIPSSHDIFALYRVNSL